MTAISEQANSIYESSRILLINTESISKEIEKIHHELLKQKLLELFRTVQANLLLFNDVVIDAMECETEEDLKFILQAADDNYLNGNEIN